ncbi:MAG: hypothetical protein JGK27_31985 [Microcoleus sp. PH2017_20_SFW_D_A]|uniref:hypothetical protein n=1 Tax=unclassified Microcoleus TaxID=2642155 RepID=UPI001DEA7B6C|nr:MULTISPECIES: hypothetical protein [unclassified Microcoleus]MCC3507263.1 hypothetical protein [Microcoleus sp. PH2017_19_SFW_U_A]MCC3526200.1 hypothetical protein [Microcoleus sp. PH2017_20_SFW_D_A]MCC3557239.1 hypothetical protein [Microcoleus sp. PH2017_35_SFW_U_B]MCC3644987.1 hypothetical protein [Microcoleus sp. PH2017_33_LGB_O_A]TAF93008.1 MAG: hypothetical protein EAZ49_00405 [Oscillatoriales cyanobacterium]
MPNRASILKQQFLQSVASPWEKLLPEKLVYSLLAKEKITYYQSIYTPIVTLWAMVSGSPELMVIILSNARNKLIRDF